MERLEQLKKQKVVNLKTDNPVSKFYQSFSILFITAVLAMAAIMFWAMFIAPPLLEYKDMPWKIMSESKQFYPGDNIPMQVIRCNSSSRPVVYTVTRSLTNIETDKVMIFESVKVTIEPGCKTAVSAIHNLPKETPPGKYRVTGVGEAPTALGIIKQVPFISEPFEVLAGPPPIIKWIATP